MNYCELKYRGKKRTGENRYWCIVHSREVLSDNFMCPIACDSLDDPSLATKQIELDLRDWEGGVGLWGAMNPIFSTHPSQGHESGIHIHTRREKGGKKIIDDTFDELLLLDKTTLFGEDNHIKINLETALSYTASNVFGIDLKCLSCPNCETLHSDEGMYAVNPHRKHLCTNCGKHFVDNEHGISNPIIAIKSRLMEGKQEFLPSMSTRELVISQKDFPGGIQIWGSNPAILWSVDKNEEMGIHVHVYKDYDSDERIFDDTYGKVIIDGIQLDHQQVRYYMVQQYLQDIIEFVKYFECPHCNTPHFDKMERARMPHSTHLCFSCEREFEKPKSIGNPIIQQLEILQKNYDDLQK